MFLFHTFFFVTVFCKIVYCPSFLSTEKYFMFSSVPPNFFRKSEFEIFLFKLLLIFIFIFFFDMYIRLKAFVLYHIFMNKSRKIA